MILKLKNGNKEKMINPEILFEFGKKLLELDDESDKMKERFYIIGLTTKNTVEYVELCTLGILNACMIHPREVFRMAILKGVDKIVIMHNHPSGAPEPSTEDDLVTEKIAAAGKIIGIKVLDHIILGDLDFYSYSKMKTI